MRLGFPFVLVCLGAIPVSLSAQEQAKTDARALVQKLCAACHKPEAVIHGRRTRDQWREAIENMIVRGARGSDEEFEAVLAYLSVRNGRVNINRASAADIAEALGIPEKDATAIVKHRREKGRFEDFEALSKVSGVDAALLEKSREAIAF